MTNREWLMEQMQNMSDEEFADVVRCGGLDIIYAMKCQGECCLDCKTNWLKSEHKEPIKLSDAERVILENVDKDYKWIARDESGILYIYTEKPEKRSSYWNEEIENELKCFNNLFQFITWNDNEPYNIEELLKNENRN